VVEHAVWVDQVFRVEYSAAVIALISTGGDVVAVWTFSFYETVWQEAFVVLTVWEDDVLFEDVSVLVQGLVEFLDELLVDRALGASIVVELDMEGFDAAGEDPVVLVSELARCDLASYGFNFYGCAVFVAARYHNYVFAFEAQVARVDIG
jgi:hypothetical protein